MSKKAPGCLLMLVGVAPWIWVYGTMQGFFPAFSFGPNANYDVLNNILRFSLFVGVGLAILGLLLFVSGSASKSPPSKRASSLSSQPKQSASPGPLLHSQISGHKEERGMNISQSSKDQAIAYCKEGERLYEQEKGREALRAFNKALKYDASLFDALIGKMESHAVLKEHAQALETAKQVLSIDQSSRSAWNCIALISWERRDYKRAWEGVNRLLSFNPNDGKALFIKAILLEEEGRVREALEIVNRAAADDPHDELLIEWRAALQQRIHKERVEKAVDRVKFSGEIAANVGKMMAQDIFLPNCLKCGVKLAPGAKICPKCRTPR